VTLEARFAFGVEIENAGVLDFGFVGVAGGVGGVGGAGFLEFSGFADGGGFEVRHAELTPAGGSHHVDEGALGGGLGGVLVVIGVEERAECFGCRNVLLFKVFQVPTLTPGRIRTLSRVDIGRGFA
jgi:hypothetical protein